MTKINNLTIVSNAEDHITPKGQKLKKLNLICLCGKKFTALKGNIMTGHTRSCGCLQPPGYHGFRGTTLYQRWDAMIQRCTNPNTEAYKNYGGRGITVCSKWREFLNFKEWAERNGFSPELELDRKRNNRGYYPLNCRWVTHSANNRNKRTNRLITYKGETKTLSEWCDIYKMPFKKLQGRLDVLKWSVEKALTTP